MRWFLLLVFLASALHGQQRRVAITFDDLPRGGDSADGRKLAAVQEMTTRLLGHLRDIPVAGFVNPGSATAQTLGEPGFQSILRLWVESGAILGNHTFSHPDYNSTLLDEYSADILKAEPALVQAIGKRPVYFRHPFLHAGKEPEARQALDRFLAERGYRVAPVTLDNSDYLFAFVYASALEDDAVLARRVREAYIDYMDSIFTFFEQWSKEVVGREFPQILLLHANRLNADAMPELLAMMKRRGYRAVSLDEALTDPVYQSRDTYAGASGISWIHRWAHTKGMEVRWEPEEPNWVRDEFRRRRALRD